MKKGALKEDVLRLYRFIDWIMALPKDLTIKFKDEIKNYEEESQMPYITSIERLGIEQGAQEMVLEAIKEKFGVFDSAIQQQVRKITSKEALREILRKCFQIDNFQAFHDEMKKYK